MTRLECLRPHPLAWPGYWDSELCIFTSSVSLKTSPAAVTWEFAPAVLSLRQHNCCQGPAEIRRVKGLSARGRGLQNHRSREKDWQDLGCVVKRRECEWAGEDTCRRHKTQIKNSFWGWISWKNNQVVRLHKFEIQAMKLLELTDDQFTTITDCLRGLWGGLCYKDTLCP